MLFSVLYTSCRPKEIQKHIELWRDLTENPGEVEFILATDQLDPASTAVALEMAENEWPFRFKTTIVPAPHRNCIIGWNHAAKEAHGHVLMATSDDFKPPLHWDTQLKNLTCGCGGPWWEHSHVVHTNDGHTSIRHGICTFPIVTFGWYTKHSYIYHPSYVELFGDQELCEVAYRDNAMIRAHHLYFEHIHYTVQKRTADEHDEKHANRRAWNIDEATFNKRKSLDFPIHEGAWYESAH
jgi:hypothetical protein